MRSALTSAFVLVLLAGCAAPPHGLPTVAPAASDPDGSPPVLTGMFSYMADAAIIRLCDDGRQLPVAMEGDYRALEAAYLKAGRPPQPMLAQAQARVAQRPAMEFGRPPVPTLVVERFVAVWPRETCGTPGADAPLLGTYWRLVRLEGAPVTAAAGQREPHLVFPAEGGRVRGGGGCNRINGSVETGDGSLRFGRLFTTRMACPDTLAQEQRFLGVLALVERYRIRGSHLELLDAGGSVRARLEAVALP